MCAVLLLLSEKSVITIVLSVTISHAIIYLNQLLIPL